MLSCWAERDLPAKCCKMEARAQDESVGDGPSDGANSVPIYSEELAVDITGTQTSCNNVETQCR